MRMSTTDPATGVVEALDHIALERRRSEMPLFVISLILGVLLWLAIIVVIVATFPIGLWVALYVVVVAAIFFFVQVGFVTHVRGNAVRLGPDQLPQLYARVCRIAARMGIKRVPDTYVMQANGALNALAARFIWSNMIVLYSHLLEACGDSEAAKDMIIGHELGHVRAGHLRWRWLLLPSRIVPFMGRALSRAREYTCDRLGLVAAGDKEGALLGLTILAAGGTFARDVNRQAMVNQRRNLNTGWMTIGQWMAMHPTLAKRISALDPASSIDLPSGAAGALRALSIFAGILVVLAAGVFVTVRGTQFSPLRQLMSFALGLNQGLFSSENDRYSSDSESSSDEYTIPKDAPAQLQAAFKTLSAFLDDEVSKGHDLPGDYTELSDRWSEVKKDPMPVDPYDGYEIGYELSDNGYTLWSSGPDGESGTDDDIEYQGGGK